MADFNNRFILQTDLLRSRAVVERRYNQNRVPHPFRIGDLVFCRNHPIINAGRGEAAKLMSRFRGPYRIATFLTPVTSRLVDPSSARFITRSHVSLLKPGKNSNND
jgi:hypothetical protein